MVSYSKHWAARQCSGCDRFLSWEPKPANRQKRQRWQAKINQLLQAQGLTDWEREFLELESVRNKGKLLPRQTEALAKIAAKVGVNS